MLLVCMYQQMEGQYIHQSPFTFFTTSISLVMFSSNYISRLKLLNCVHAHRCTEYGRVRVRIMFRVQEHG